jgi:hypothetical protein
MTEELTMNNEGKLTVWRTDGPLDEMIFEVSANLTAGDERLIVVDAAGCLIPRA